MASRFELVKCIFIFLTLITFTVSLNDEFPGLLKNSFYFIPYMETDSLIYPCTYHYELVYRFTIL